MGKFGVYDEYGAMLDDEQRLEALRAKGDTLTPQEVEEKLALFRTFHTTGRRYSDTRIVNTVMPPERPAQEQTPTDTTADQRQAEARFADLRERQFALTAPEQRDLRQLYWRFGAQPERYARSGVKLHIGQ